MATYKHRLFIRTYLRSSAAVVIKKSNSAQNGKNISRKVAKLAKKDLIICF